jgi:hypothetical protein
VAAHQPGASRPNPYDGVLEAGMVVTVESYMGAVGERDGVKLEEQVLITEDGVEQLSSYPLEESLMATSRHSQKRAVVRGPHKARRDFPAFKHRFFGGARRDAVSDLAP